MDPTNNILSDIRERMVRVETKIDTMTEVQTTADGAKEVANKALESTKSAHRRLDKMDKIIFWASTLIIGAVVLALIATAFKGGV
ncbi:hemolysin XhlA family protein [Sporosarcina sp. FSL K6-5500]|uniref:hemolysin XhlA family protein n=1 Tax=Sporosarcina sp. FSL K6-5500 TaxID=2921558 RepID=UPI0030F8DFC0